MHVWNAYHEAFADLEADGKLIRPYIPSYSTHNAHLYYFFVKNAATRNEMLDYLKQNGIGAVFHYIPLHTSPMGERLGYHKGDLPLTEEYAARLIRLPLHANLTDGEIEYIIDKVKAVLDHDQTV